MGERMTGERLARIFTGRILSSEKGELFDEIQRARASEAEKDAAIKALADALERHGFACRVANPATPCFCIGCETRAALRLAGRL